MNRFYFVKKEIKEIKINISIIEYSKNIFGFQSTKFIKIDKKEVNDDKEKLF